MSYLDMKNIYDLGLLDQEKYFNTANQMRGTEFGPPTVNPYSSGAYVPKTARDIYNYTPEIDNPMSEFSEYKPYGSMENIMMQGSQGLQYGSLAKTLSPYVSDAASLFTGKVTDLGGGMKYLEGAEGAEGTWVPGGKENIGFDLGPAATVYGLTQDQNPYKFTSTEALGTTASTMMAAHQLSKLLPASSMLAGGVGAANTLGTMAATKGAMAGTKLAAVNPYVMLAALAFSWWANKKKKKKAKRLVKEAQAETDKATKEVYETREEAVRDMREEMISDQQAQMLEERQARYDNQYGGNYSARLYEEGGKNNIVAEFTGNELIVNDQDALEKDLADGNTARVATRIRKAMKGGKITPGPETHKNNPMPVDSKGNIYAAGGTLPFKVKKGAGIYDHATDQFKPDMTDKEITKVVKENISKWKSNEMYA